MDMTGTLLVNGSLIDWVRQYSKLEYLVSGCWFNKPIAISDSNQTGNASANNRATTLTQIKKRPLSVDRQPI